LTRRSLARLVACPGAAVAQGCVESVPPAGGSGVAGRGARGWRLMPDQGVHQGWGDKKVRISGAGMGARLQRWSPPPARPVDRPLDAGHDLRRPRSACVRCDSRMAQICAVGRPCRPILQIEGSRRSVRSWIMAGRPVMTTAMATAGIGSDSRSSLVRKEVLALIFNLTGTHPPAASAARPPDGPAQGPVPICPPGRWLPAPGWPGKASPGNARLTLAAPQIKNSFSYGRWTMLVQRRTGRTPHCHART
jgi:hypothetical protein